MGTGRIVLDTLPAFFLETGDYVSFVLEGEPHEGTVTALEDLGEAVTVTLYDESDLGDPTPYSVPAETEIQVLGYDLADVA